MKTQVIGVWLVVALACRAVDSPGEPPFYVDDGTPSDPTVVTLVTVTQDSVAGVDVEEMQDSLFADDVLPEFRIELSEQAINQLAGSPYDWVEGAIVYMDLRYSPVGIRLKGENSFLPIDEKPSWKVKLDYVNDDMRLWGLRELTLNNMRSDPSMMHERISYRVFREVGLPASRSTHALVWLNDDFYGLYANVETVDRAMMDRWGDDSGTMYEVWDVDFLDQYIDFFQLEFGEDARWALQGTADALEGNGQDALDAASVYMDFDQFAEYLGASGWVGQYDAYPYSSPGDDAHVYLEPSDDRFQWVPHGMDETFFDESRRPLANINGIVGTACLDVLSCEENVIAALWRTQEKMEEIDLLQYASDVVAQIEPWVIDDTRKPYSNGAVWDEQDDVLDWIDGRRGRLEDWYDGPP